MNPEQKKVFSFQVKRPDGAAYEVLVVTRNGESVADAREVLDSMIDAIDGAPGRSRYQRISDGQILLTPVICTRCHE